MSKLSTVIEDLPLPDEEEDMHAPILSEPPLPHASAPARPQPELTWQTLVLSPPFLKAVLLSFVVVIAMLLVPLEDYVFKYVPFLATVPHAAECIKALAAAAAITFMRPPDLSDTA
jgi:hypothetical protein